MNRKIIVALDGMEKKQIIEIVRELNEDAIFKINDAFTSFGHSIIEFIKKKGGEVFLDLKFHDIPNTVANYARVAAQHGVFMFNIHCLGGYDMMKAARNAVDEYCKRHGVRKPLLLGVTILTSMDDSNLRDELKVNFSLNTMVEHLSLLAKKAGLDGVVCSPREIKSVKESCGKNFITVTPGVRPKWAGSDDQKRVMTPKEAVIEGSDYLVIGRPITKSDIHGYSYKEAFEKIQEEIN